MKRFFVLMICAGFGFSLPSLASEQPDTASMTGKQLYQSFCASCHGIKMDGRGPLARSIIPAPPSLKEHVRKHPQAMKSMHPIMHGEGPMPSWQSILSHEEAFSIVKYLRSESEKNE